MEFILFHNAAWWLLPQPLPVVQKYVLQLYILYYDVAFFSIDKEQENDVCAGTDQGID